MNNNIDVTRCLFESTMLINACMTLLSVSAYDDMAEQCFPNHGRPNCFDGLLTNFYNYNLNLYSI